MNAYPSDSTSQHPDHIPYAVAPQSGIELGDIYYTLFRHKWKIIILGLIGLGVAAYLVKTSEKSYHSVARLLVRYIKEEKTIEAPDTNSGVKTPGGDSIMGAEIAILTSTDVALKTVDSLGAEKLLGSDQGAGSRNTAAAVIIGGLDVDTVQHSGNVLEISFRSTNMNLVQPVLSALIDQYLQRHKEVHTPSGAFDETLVQQTDQLRTRLAATEEQLMEEQKKLGIISLDDAKKTFSDQMNQLRTEIFQLKAALAERKVTLERYMKLTGGKLPEPDKPATEEALDTSSLPIAEYQSLIERYNTQKAFKEESLKTYTPESTRIARINETLVNLEKQKAEIEAKFPALLQVTTTKPATTALGTTTKVVDGKERRVEYDPMMENAQIQALGTRIQVREAQLDEVRAENERVSRAEVKIQELMRRRTLEDTHYRYLKQTLDQTRINDSLGSGRVTNITTIQHPTPPILERSKSLKFAAVAAVGGFALGIGWAFLIDMLLDRTIKRPIDVGRKGGLNLFLSIPDVGQSKRPRLRGPSGQPQLPTGRSEAGGAPSSKVNESIAPWVTDNGKLQPYYDTLRDRVIGFFESENLTHKPKLIALTGVGKNASDPSVAAGLASSLSETEGGNVLFVDMTSGQGSAQQFLKGEAVGSIDDALIAKDKAQVQENLFVVSEVGKGDRLPRALPMRFSHLIPKLKASDFDFIIFNMPPVSSVSVTPRLAAFMDFVLLIIESEKTDRDLVTRARDLLAESKTPVGAILNRTKTYVPKAIYQDSADQI